jgi:hypothetical protein
MFEIKESRKFEMKAIMQHGIWEALRDLIMLEYWIRRGMGCRFRWDGGYKKYLYKFIEEGSQSTSKA